MDKGDIFELATNVTDTVNLMNSSTQLLVGGTSCSRNTQKIRILPSLGPRTSRNVRTYASSAVLFQSYYKMVDKHKSKVIVHTNKQTN